MWTARRCYAVNPAHDNFVKASRTQNLISGPWNVELFWAIKNLTAKVITDEEYVTGKQNKSRKSIDSLHVSVILLKFCKYLTEHIKFSWEEKWNFTICRVEVILLMKWIKSKIVDIAFRPHSSNTFTRDRLKKNQNNGELLLLSLENNDLINFIY